MSKGFTRILLTSLVFILGISVVAGWFYYSESQKLEVHLPNARWEPILFRFIDATTKVGGLEKLRTIRLIGGDVEIRVWRGFGVEDLEGVILKRTDDEWKAFHVAARGAVGDYAPEKAEVTELNPPKSGWEYLWNKLTEKGLLSLRDPSEANCEDNGLDGTSYVVEVNQNKIYRTYQMREDGKCPGVREMEGIDDLIGEEFDSGREQCKANEWFACATLRKARRGVHQH